MTPGNKRPTPARVALGEVARFITALQSSKSATTGGDRAVRAISPAALRGRELVPEDGSKVIRPRSDVDRYRVEVGDILVPLHLPLDVAEVGPAFDFGTDPVIATGSLSIVRVDSIRADPTYIAWALRRPEAQHALETASIGTSLRFIKQSELAALSLPLPPLDRQRRIAAALQAERRVRDLETAIAGSRRLYVDALAARAAGH